MAVVVENLTKIYGAQRAIDALNFEIKKGEIIGFLGPNGAGKTTTMKILSCFMPSTEGTANICGFDVHKDPMEVRKHVGYLPEHNPLYKDMYVQEYLSFVAGVLKIENAKSRIGEMIEKTGLEREQHKLISSLSKGYKQRIGLAQALMNDPEVLILDEPTSGLDPNQLVEIRSVIKDFGKEKTVIFSSHIMQEVQALCDRVIILNKGQIIADDPMDRLKQKVKGNRIIYVAFDREINPAVFKDIPGVDQIKAISPTSLEIISNGSEDIRPLIFKEVVKSGQILIEMKEEQVSVENIFQELTTHA